MLADRVQSLPGVLGAAYTRQLPMVRARSLVALRTTPELPAEAAPPPAPPGVANPPEWPDTRHVSHDYPDVMGIDVVAGRGFDEGDGPGRQALLINRTLERSGLLGPDPVGRHVYALGILPWQVVGVIEDVHQSGLDHDRVRRCSWTSGSYPTPRRSRGPCTSRSARVRMIPRR